MALRHYGSSRLPRFRTFFRAFALIRSSAASNRMFGIFTSQRRVSRYLRRNDLIDLITKHMFFSVTEIDLFLKRALAESFDEGEGVQKTEI